MTIINLSFLHNSSVWIQTIRSDLSMDMTTSHDLFWRVCFININYYHTYGYHTFFQNQACLRYGYAPYFLRIVDVPAGDLVSLEAVVGEEAWHPSERSLLSYIFINSRWIYPTASIQSAGSILRLAFAYSQPDPTYALHTVQTILKQRVPNPILCLPSSKLIAVFFSRFPGLFLQETNECTSLLSLWSSFSLESLTKPKLLRNVAQDASVKTMSLLQQARLSWPLVDGKMLQSGPAPVHPIQDVSHEAHKWLVPSSQVS